MRLELVPVLLLLSLTASIPAQDAKASIRIVNDTEDERIVEINKAPVKVKGKSEAIIAIPAGDFTYKLIGVDDTPHKRNVKIGETWGMTIRATVTIMPGEKELPPKVKPTEEKIKPVEQLPEPVFDKSKMARILIKLPNENTTVKVDGVEMPAKKVLTRSFMTPELGNKTVTWFYTINACWEDDRGVKQSVTYKVMFRCGDEVCVDFTRPPTVFAPPMYYSGGCGRW